MTQHGCPHGPLDEGETCPRCERDKALRDEQAKALTPEMKRLHDKVVDDYREQGRAEIRERVDPVLRAAMAVRNYENTLAHSSVVESLDKKRIQAWLKVARKELRVALDACPEAQRVRDKEKL